MTPNPSLFNHQQTKMPYIIPMVDIDITKTGLIIDKISCFNDIIKLVDNRHPIYQINNFIEDINNPRLYIPLRQDFLSTLQIIFDNPEKVWTHENPEVIETIEAIKRYFKPFRATTALLFESAQGQFNWDQINQNGSTVPFYFFECMHIFFGIQCFIPNTGSLINNKSPLTAQLTNHGEHFSIGPHYLLTRADGNCFFHLHCQLLAAVCIKHMTFQTELNHLLNLSYECAIRKKNDQLLRFFYKIQTKTQCLQLLQTLFENHFKDFEDLNQPSMIDLSAHLIANFFEINIREHHINTSGETFLKKTYGDTKSIWFFDTFIYNDKKYSSDETLGQWKEITSYQDYLASLALLWHPSLSRTNAMKSQVSP